MKPKKELPYWHAQSGQEVDFVIGNKVASELKGLRAFREGVQWRTASSRDNAGEGFSGQALG